MKTKSKIFLKSSLLLFLCVTFFSFVVPQDQKAGGPWKIPSKYKAMKNPYAQDKGLTKTGKMLFAINCKSCHGTKGKGDGSKSDQLKTLPGNFTTDAFKKQTDGEIYYKMINGRNEMPTFKETITDEDEQWAIVNYIRTLGEK